MSILAIKGHATRGKEVIEILKMLGGKMQNDRLTGDASFSWYYINKNGCIDYKHYLLFDNTTFFTLEEFLEKFPYKVGDKVIVNKNVEIINRMRWNGNEIVYGFFTTHNLGELTVNIIKPYKEETIDRKYNVEEYLKVWKETEIGLEVLVNDNFELKEDSGKFYIIKKQLQYPKTYEECCSILGCKANHFFTDFSYNGLDVEISDYEYKIEDLLQNFRNLIYCRDAYWKLYGKQMGLGKAWKPDWKSSKEEIKYGILYDGGEKYNSMTYTTSMVLVFPTAEIRDAFYDNFKDLIEQCKELL